jgi:flavin reductase (DIM6/NTAB) family NADH-FMN oxidoreductase RutF/DNA-binding FadR family transcriptional regulator
MKSEDPSNGVGTQVVDDIAFRNVIGHFASGVAVITCRTAEGEVFGMTASAVSSVSLDPPTLLVCLNQGSATHNAILETGYFAVNILHDDQGGIARRFATFGADKFGGLELAAGPLGQPMLVDALANIECRVTSHTIGGTHRVFVAEVEYADAHPGQPLAYYRGQFGHLMHANELDVYETVRTRVIEGDPEFQRDLSASRIADLLEVPTPAAYYALNRLAAAGVLQVEKSTGLFNAQIRPMALSDSVIDARMSIELGAIDLVGDRLSNENIDELAMLVERIRKSLTTEGVSAVQREADQDTFHDRMITFTHNDMLVETYRRLTIRGVPAGRMSGDEAATIIGTYGAILDSLRDHRVDVARAAISEQYHMRKSIARRPTMGAFLLSE